MRHSVGLCFFREQPALGLEARQAAASLWMHLGRLHLTPDQPSAAESDAPAVTVQPEKAVHCFKQAALEMQSFGKL